MYHIIVFKVTCYAVRTGNPRRKKKMLVGEKETIRRI